MATEIVKILKNQFFICLLLVITILALYWRVHLYEFVNYDDSIYVYENPFISKGLTKDNVITAFKTLYTSNWHPLTWLSLMLDYKLFSLNASGYHWTNVIFHLFNSIGLFLILKGITKETWKSALVALLFAVHPLNVESVAWISERKNVLSAFFWLSTMGLYFLYVKSPSIHRYCFMLFIFMLGLMTKPVLVTLPLILLLFDYWPLQRLSRTKDEGNEGAVSIVQLIWEKVPLFLLSVSSMVITVYAAAQGGAIKTLEKYPWDSRLANAVSAYVKYILKMIYPDNLACFYPYPKTYSIWMVLVAGIFLVGITTICILNAKRFRYLFVGWFWYLTVMFPVIGLIQVGYQSMADRYAYIPLIGLFIIMVWGGADIMEKVFKPKRFMPYIISFAFVGILTLIASNQIRYWESSEVLFRHAMQVTTNNHIAIAGIGNEYLKKGKMEEAALYLLEAIKIMPDYPEAHNNLGIVYLKQSKLDEAIYEFGEAVKYKPSLARAHNNMGVALSMKGNYRDAIVKYHDALREDPNYINAKENLTKTLYNYHHNKISGHP